MTSKIEKAARDFEVLENAIPPRNRGEKRHMAAYMRGRRAGFLAGAQRVLEHAVTNEGKWAIGDDVCGTGCVKISVLKELFEEEKQ